MKMVYNREIAVKEGYRNSVEINKSYFKRPRMIVNKEGLIVSKGEETLERKIENKLASITQIFDGVIMSVIPSLVKETVTHNEYKKSRVRGKWATTKFQKEITIEKALELENFKDKTIFCYVEKQYNNKYDICPAGSKRGDAYEIELDGFYNIAGREIYINLDKIDGKFKVREVVPY
ncbi:MAG: hypothetical protein M0Q88_02725 [Bacilli bacterium]|nr:hypothetical protein [Bacilli bacterium]